MNLDDLELELRMLRGVRAAAVEARDDVLLVQLHVTGSGVEPGLSARATQLAMRHSGLPVGVEVVRWRDSGAPAAAATATHATGGRSGRVDATGSRQAFRGAGPTLAGPDETTLEAVETDEVETEPVTEAEPVAATDAIDLTGETEPATEAPSAPADGHEPRERRVRLLAVLTFPDTDELEVHLTFAGKRSIGRAPASRGVLGSAEAAVDGLRAFVPAVAFSPTWARPLESGNGRQTYLVACELHDGEGRVRHGLASGASPIEASARSALHALNRTIAGDLAALS